MSDDDDSEEDKEVVVIRNVTLTAIEDKILALEKELEDSSDDESSEEGDEEEEEEEERPRKKQRITNVSIGGGAKICCEVCSVYVIGEDKLEEHINGRKHGDKLRERLKSNYEAAGIFYIHTIGF